MKLMVLCMSFSVFSFQVLAFPKKISCLSTNGKYSIRMVNKKTKDSFADLSVGYRVLFKFTYLHNDNKNHRGYFNLYSYEQKEGLHTFLAESTKVVTGEEQGPEKTYMSVQSWDLKKGEGTLEFLYDQDQDGKKEEHILNVDCFLTEEP